MTPAPKGQYALTVPFPVHVIVDGVGHDWTVPVGFVTDGASVPAIFWAVVNNPYAPSSLRAAILHDWLCRGPVYPVSSTTACEVFYTALRADGCAWARSRAMWLAVRWFGPAFRATASLNVGMHSPRWPRRL